MDGYQSGGVSLRVMAACNGDELGFKQKPRHHCYLFIGENTFNPCRGMIAVDVMHFMPSIFPLPACHRRGEYGGDGAPRGKEESRR